MISHRTIISALLISICTATSVFSQANDVNTLANQIIQTVNKYHYQPADLDDSLSLQIFDLTIQQLDPLCLILDKQTVTELEKYKFDIDDQIRAKKITFIDDISSVFNKKLSSIDGFINEICQDDIKFNKEEYLNIGSKPQRLSQEKTSKKWLGLLKLGILDKAHGSEDNPIIPVPQIKLDSIFNQTLEHIKCTIESIKSELKNNNKYIQDCFLKAIAQSFDPHSTYFSAQDKESHSNDLSASNFSFGFYISPSNIGDLEVTHLVPGGPAWNSNRINVNDVIVGAEDINGNYFDFNCRATEDIRNIFSSPSIKTIKFKVRKKNDQVINVVLTKADIDVDQNTIRSFVLKDNNKIAYIYLPSFYRAGESDSYFGQGCSKDLATELIKLKKDGIEGLILDLRNNGGGAMEEAVRIAGLFIDYGPVCISDSQGEVMTLKDMDRGQVYKGPLTVMINENSASASELVAAALQDYQRAVVVGNTSHGKSTSQVILPLDAYKYSPERMDKSKSPHFIKLTTGAFYKVTGKTHQGTGVVPDVIIPNLELENHREESYSNTLVLDELDKKTYYKAQDPLPLASLKKNSFSRTDIHERFSEIKRLNGLKTAKMKAYNIPLSHKEYVEHKKEWKDLYKLNDEKSSESQLSIEDPSYVNDLDIIQLDDPSTQEKIKKDIQEDIYIQETFYILQDLIKHLNDE